MFALQRANALSTKRALATSPTQKKKNSQRTLSERKRLTDGRRAQSTKPSSEFMYVNTCLRRERTKFDAKRIGGNLAVTVNVDVCDTDLTVAARSTRLSDGDFAGRMCNFSLRFQNR